jgi:hypothetical protein
MYLRKRDLRCLNRRFVSRQSASLDAGRDVSRMLKVAGRARRQTWGLGINPTYGGYLSVLGFELCLSKETYKNDLAKTSLPYRSCRQSKIFLEPRDLKSAVSIGIC